MRRIGKHWRTVMFVVTFCLMFGGTAVAPMAVSAYSVSAYQGAIQGSAAYLPPSPCRAYYASY